MKKNNTDVVEINWKSYRITVDKLQFTLQVRHTAKKKETGEEYERITEEGYFHTLDNCLRRVVRLETLKHKDTYELKQYIDLYKSISLQLKADLHHELSVASY